MIGCGVFSRVNAETPVGSDADSIDRNQQIRDLSEASSPIFLSNGNPDSERVANTILFTFSENDLNPGPSFTNNTRKTVNTPEKNVSRVSIAFGHEGWSILHPLQKIYSDKTVSNSRHSKMAIKRSPVFFIYYVLDRETQEHLLINGSPLEYRFIVDGIWMADPRNNSSVRKINGALVSTLDVHNAPPAPVISPEIIMPARPAISRLISTNPESANLTALASTRQARTVIVRWVGAPDQEVFVAGSFNQFDPYLTPMIASGTDPRHPSQTVYSAELRLLAGQYYYHFVINGRTYLDNLNNRHGYDAEGITYSQLQVP